MSKRKSRVITNRESGTNIEEISDGIYRINTPMPPSFIPGGFSFNQYLIADDEPLLFHTGLKKHFPLVLEAVRAVLPPQTLRYLAFSHFESDECGALNEWLTIAPEAEPVCSQVAAMVSVDDYALRPARALAHQEVLQTGKHRLTWFDTPHLPHGWETGYLFDKTSRTLFCGDLFTQPGTGEYALTAQDILEPSEASRANMDYFSHSRRAPELFEMLAANEPATLACMHGSAWQGDGGGLLRALSQRVSE